MLYIDVQRMVSVCFNGLEIQTCSQYYEKNVSIDKM